MKFKLRHHFLPLLTLSFGMASTVTAADRRWDGGTASIGPTGDGLSAGGSGTWSTAITNWDQGNGLAHLAWNNDGNDTAIFGGTGATVTLGTPVRADQLVFLNTSGTYVLDSTTNALTVSGTAPGLSAATTTQIRSALVGSAGLVKSGPGLLTLQSRDTNSSFTGGLTINQGIVEFDLHNHTTAANPVDMIAPSNSLILNNGYLRVRAKTGATSSQTLGAVNIAGAAGLNITHQTGTGTVSTMTLGAITRGAGSTLSFSNSTNGTSSDFHVPAATDLGNWAVFSTAGGLGGTAPMVRYAAVDGAGKVIARAGTAVATGSLGDDSAANYEIADAGTTPLTVSANSIRYTGTGGTTALNTTDGASFTVNSLMHGRQDGANAWIIGTSAAAGGTLSIGSNKELVIHPGAAMTINSKIVDGTPGSGVTINGYYNGTNAGVVTLGGTNTYTGITVVNGSNTFASGGHVIGNTLADDGSAFGAGGKLVLNGATLRTAPSSVQTTGRGMEWQGNSGIVIANSNLTQTVTFSGNIAGSGTLTVDQNPTSAALVLSGDNTYSGEFLLNQTDSKLVIASANAAKNATLNIAGQRVHFSLSGNHEFNIGGLKGNALDLNLGSGLAGGGSGMVSIGSNHVSNVFQGALSGDAGLIKKGTGTQTLVKTTHTGATVVEAGTLKLGAVPQSSFAGNMNVTNDSTYGRWRVQIANSGQYAASLAYAVGQKVTIGATENEVWGIGYDTSNIYLYLKDTPTTTGNNLTGSIGALDGSIASTTIEVRAGAFLDVGSLNGFTLGAGQTLAGSGTVTGTMTVAGTISPGESPGTLITGSQVWTNGGAYNWQVHNASGTAGSGYDTLAITGTLDLGNLTTNGFGINLWSLSSISPADVNGNATGFDNTADYAWTILTAAAGITGFEAADFALNTAASNGTEGFTNALAGGAFSLNQSGNSLVLQFTAVPEPSALLLCGLGTLLVLRRRR